MPESHRRRSIRAPAHEYAGHGAYFVTIVTAHRRCLFGDVVDGVMRQSPLGAIVAEQLEATARLRGNVELDAHIVMPNHVHVILWITAEKPTRNAPASSRVFGAPIAGSLPVIVNRFKGAVTRAARQASGQATDVWQRGYHERVIRTPRELDAVRAYVDDNPRRWSDDPENPAVAGPR